MPDAVKAAASETYRPGSDSFVIDATVGGGGHSKLLLEANPSTSVLGVDRDPDAIAAAEARLRPFRDAKRFASFCGSYATLAGETRPPSLPSWVPELRSSASFVLADIGVSSHQLDTASRGFSFRHSGPLDMRFNQTATGGVTAGELVNSLPERQLADVFARLGEEPHASAAARAVTLRREQLAKHGRAIDSTGELASVLKQAIERAQRSGGQRRRRGASSSSHPATRCFQALRIAVNQELHHVQMLPRVAALVLRPGGGRLAVITFQRFEDQVLFSAAQRCPQLRLATKRPLVPPPEEVAANPRARTAKMWVWERQQ